MKSIHQHKLLKIKYFPKNTLELILPLLIDRIN